MIEYTDLIVQNVGLYKNAKFDLGYKGISVVYGDNRQANPGGTNAVGKSWLFQMLPETLGITPPLVKKREKRKSGHSTVIFNKNNRTYESSLRVTGTREHYVIKRDGKDLKVRKKGWAEARLAALVDRTEEEFYTLDYIDSGRPHPLHRGTTQQRRDFIISMFRLSNVDNLRKLFNSELRRISEDRSVYDEIQRQRKGLSEQLVEESEASLRERVEKLEKRYKKLSVQVQNLTSKVELISFRKDNKENIDRLLKLTDGSLENYEEYLHNYRDKVDSLELQLKDARKLSQYREKVAEYKKRRAPLEALLEKYQVKLKDVDKGHAFYDAYCVKHTLTTRSIKELKDSLPDKQEVDEELASLDAEALRTRISNLESLLETAQKFEGGVCPLCGSSVKAHDPEEIKVKLKKLKKRELRVLEEKKKQEARIQRQKKLKAIKSLLELQKHQARKVDKYVHFEKLFSLKNKLPDKPDPYTGEMVDEQEVEKALKKAKARYTFMQSMAPILQKIIDCSKLGIEDEQEVANFETIRQNLDEVVRRLPVARSTLDKMESIKKTLADLKIRANELKNSVEDEEAYRLLVEAYGNSGIKKLMLQRIGSHLEASLNRYAKFVFSERYQFKVRIDTQFDILVKRQYANRSLISDVKKLSGAESRAYVLLLYLSLLSLVPASRRSNILILDEPTVNLGPEMRANFSRFLQVLKKVVPHIIIITPQSDEKYEGARYFTVVKEHGYSTLVREKAYNAITDNRKTA